jgi:hypothetical protein
LVAPNVTAPQPPQQAAPPRPVARSTVSTGETTVGAPVTPVAPGPSEPAAAQPGAVTPVKPAAPANRPKPAKQTPTRKILPGDLVCGDCGEGNPPARNFCSRCGATLKNAAVAKRAWWKRLVPRRRRKTLEAGARPWKEADGGQKQRRRGGALAKVYVKLRPIVAAALLLAGLLVGFSPNLRERVTGEISDAKDSVMRRIQPTYVPLQPIEIVGNGEVPEQPVTNVNDGNTLSTWVVPGEVLEPALVFRFDEPFDLERIKVWNGAAEGFKDRERARTLHFVFDTNRTFDVELKDLPSGEEYAIENAEGVQEVQIFVQETYTSLTDDDLAISEIEFYFKR